MCIYICIPRGRVGDFCANIYASRAERVKLVRENPIVVSNVAELAIANPRSTMKSHFDS